MLYEISITLEDIVPYQIIPERFPHLYTAKSWAWAVKQRNQNGLGRAFRKVGKNLFVNQKVLAQCIDAQIED
ncbi:MAG: hypothetical protein PSV18_06655 [Methylobacter sp.]|nr:hypothetical protein [Candidatus Methylobacter titanis]